MKTHNKILLIGILLLVLVPIVVVVLNHLYVKFGAIVILITALWGFVILFILVGYAEAYDNSPSKSELEKENEKLKAELEKQKYINIYEEAEK